METIDFLRRTSLFGSCSDKDLELVLGTARQRRFAAGKKIIREGHEGGQGFYLILSGKAVVEKAGRHLADFGPGDYFGEMALLLDDTPRTADVIATEDTACLVITSWDFKALLHSNPDLGTTIVTELARRLADTDRALSE